MQDIDHLRKKLIESAKKKVQEKYEGKDVHIAKSVNLIEDLDSITNLLVEQLREWHSTHFPELNEIVKENSEYAKLVYNIGARQKFTEKNVSEHISTPEDAARISGAAKSSMGASASEADLNEMKLLALNYLNLAEEREYLSKYVEENMRAEMPNFAEIAGPIIAAKMLAKAGGKQKLAFLPGSAIQMIGAEKALFMHIRKGVKGPKYGYLYQHSVVKAAKAWNKGKLARTIAAKLSIAAKEDYFGHTDITAQLKKSIEARAETLEKSTKEPKHRETSEAPQNENTRKEAGTERGFQRPRSEYAPRKPEFTEFRPKRFEERRPNTFREKRFEENAPRREYGERSAERPRTDFREKRFGERPPRREYGSGFGERRSQGEGNRSFNRERPPYRREPTAQGNRFEGAPRRTFGNYNRGPRNESVDRPRGTGFGFKPRDNDRPRERSTGFESRNEGRGEAGSGFSKSKKFGRGKEFSGNRNKKNWKPRRR